MHISKVLRCFAALLATLTLTPVALAQDGSIMEAYRLATIMDPNAPVKSLDDWDAIVNLLGRSSWQIHENDRGERTIAGQSLGAYWDQYLLVAEQKAKIDSLREKARQQSEAGNAKGVETTIAEATPLLAAERYKAAVLMAFSYSATSITYQRTLLDPWLERAQPAERTTADQQTDAGHGALTKALADAVRAKKYEAGYVKTFADSAHKSLDALNAQRLRLVKEQASMPNPISIPPVSRATSCPEAVPPAKDRERPSLGGDFPSSENFYPAFAKRAQVQGAVTLRTSISDTGCLMRAEIAESSGDRTLDQGALELAMAGSYVPGSKDGKAIPGEMKFRVKFELQD